MKTPPTWFLVDSGPNPSTDFFVAPHLASMGGEVVNCLWSDTPPVDAPTPGTNLVFVRYVTSSWLQWVRRHRQLLNRVVYFMDDDLFDRKAWAGQRWRYQWRLYQKAHKHKVALEACMTELWVSSPVMAEKYRHLPVTLVAPQSPYLECESDQAPDTGNQHNPILFYHGSASHEADLIWLHDVFKAVLTEHPTVVVELVADQRLRRHYTDLKKAFKDRLNLVSPMPWPDYKKFITNPGRTIGLAPLLPVPFNKARAPTKVFDIHAAGAKGLYAESPVYASMVAKSQTDQLVPMRKEAWIETVLALLPRL